MLAGGSQKRSPEWGHVNTSRGTWGCWSPLSRVEKVESVSASKPPLWTDAACQGRLTPLWCPARGRRGSPESRRTISPVYGILYHLDIFAIAIGFFWSNLFFLLRRITPMLWFANSSTINCVSWKLWNLPGNLFIVKTDDCFVNMMLIVLSAPVQWLIKPFRLLSPPLIELIPSISLSSNSSNFKALEFDVGFWPSEISTSTLVDEPSCPPILKSEQHINCVSLNFPLPPLFYSPFGTIVASKPIGKK